MTNNRLTDWTPEDEYKLSLSYSHYASSPNKWMLISQDMGKTKDACRNHWRLHGSRLKTRLQASPYPRYDEPLSSEGDALILPDPEFPFHHADFINRCLDLSQAWKIDKCIIGGDMLHFDSLSMWEPQWEKPNGKGGLDSKQETAFIEFAKKLGKRHGVKLL